MELTCAMLEDLLKPEYHIGHRGPREPDMTISQIQLYTGKCEENNTVYLTNQEETPEDPRILRILETPCRVPDRGWFLQVPPGQGQTAVNDVLRTFQRFLRWREQCVKASNVDHDLDSLLEISSEFLGVQFSMVTWDYKVDAIGSRTMPRWQDGEFQKEDMTRSEVEALYLRDPNFDETFKTQGLCFYERYQMNAAGLYYFNIFYESVYLGRLLLAVHDLLNGPGLLKLLEQLCEEVAECYRFLYLRRHQRLPEHKFYDLWRDLLENKPVDQDAAHRLLEEMGWQPEDRYQIIRLSSIGYFHSEQTLKYYAVQMESLFPSCVTAQLEGGLYCLRNLDRDKAGDFRQRLSFFLRENLFKAGISSPFQDIFDSSRYRLQARQALELGQKKDPSLWRYVFADYLPEYTMKQLLCEFPARDLCPENLRLLLEYDRAHPEAGLAQTLFQYYACQFNANQAAQKLCIHRTTFFYRMNRIQSIAPFRPEDWREHLQILLAFAALEEEDRVTSQLS